MAIADRKERALREREKLILEHADAMLRESGYLGLNLDEVARRIEYSKATIYNHFKTKEDLVLAVAVAHIEIRTEFFGRALSFDGSSRERMFVIGGADTILSKLNPHWFPILQLVRSQSIWEKASDEQHERYTQATRACMAIPKEIIRQGRESGDIPLEALPDETRAQARALLERHACWEPLWRTPNLESRHDPDGEVPFRGRKVHYDLGRTKAG